MQIREGCRFYGCPWLITPLTLVNSSDLSSFEELPRINSWVLTLTGEAPVRTDASVRCSCQFQLSDCPAAPRVRHKQRQNLPNPQTTRHSDELWVDRTLLQRFEKIP